MPDADATVAHYASPTKDWGARSFAHIREKTACAADEQKAVPLLQILRLRDRHHRDWNPRRLAAGVVLVQRHPRCSG